MRKLLSLFFYPVTWLFLLMVMALVWRKRRVCLLLAALVLFIMTGYPWLPNALLRSLAERYPVVTVVDAEIIDIVVLAAGGFSPGEGPVNSRWSRDSVDRFIEGVRLHRALPGSRLWISVSRPNDEMEALALMPELAELVAVPPEGLHPFTGARTTGHEAQLMRQRLSAGTRVYLVTHDVHMPRSMLLFERAGLQPVAAPVRRDLKLPASLHAYLLPSLSNLMDTQRALHEYWGMLAARLGKHRTPCDHSPCDH